METHYTLKFYSVRLLVEDFPACFRFYRDVLGLQPVWGDESGPYADFQVDGGAMLSLFKRDLMATAVGAESRPAGTSCQDVSVIVLQVDNVDETFASLRSRGTEFLNKPMDYPAWTIRAVHLRDPDGALIELFSPLAREQWTEAAREKDIEASSA